MTYYGMFPGSADNNNINSGDEYLYIKTINDNNNINKSKLCSAWRT